MDSEKKPEKARPNVRPLFKPASWDKIHFKLNLSEKGFDEARKIEWVLANGLGGYCSQTASGELSRRFHGLLVSSSSGFERFVFLQSLFERVCVGGRDFVLAPDFEGDVLFEAGLDVVRFSFVHPKFVLRRVYGVIAGKNVLRVGYDVFNRSGEYLELQAHPLLNPRPLEGVGVEGFSSSVVSSRVLCVKSPYGGMILNCFDGVCRPKEPAESFPSSCLLDGFSERLSSPAHFMFRVKPGEKKSLIIFALAYETEELAGKNFKEVLSGNASSSTGVISDRFGSEILSLLSTSKSFMVDFQGKKMITAGYHPLGLSVREALISLPGLALMQKDYDAAEKTLELILNNVRGGMLPSRLGGPATQKNQFDAPLWLIECVHQFVKYRGFEDAGGFLHTYWWTLKDILKQYLDLERDGILCHDGGTWMGEGRRNAVEVQALWFNALNIMKNLAGLMGDELSLDARIKDSKKAFDEVYWNGSFLSDYEGDASLKPCQLIALSLDYSPVESGCALKVLSSCERGLVTPVGLRTLAPSDPAYVGDGSRLFDGSCWPWLAGPYVRACVKFRKGAGVKKAAEYLKNFFMQASSAPCLFSVSQFFSGDSPHKPFGCISYAPSVSEPLRSYFENVLGRKTESEKS